MNTQENNQLIAEFMAFTQEKNIGWYDNDMLMSQNVYDSQDGNCFDELLFHTSWDWLMPVVEKIERQYKANFIIKCIWNEFNECSCYQVIVTIEKGEMSKDRACIYSPKKIYDYIGDTSKCKEEATYEAVVEFIKQYKLN